MRQLIFISSATIAVFCTGTVARADVMEVKEGGYQWVAGRTARMIQPAHQADGTTWLSSTTNGIAPPAQWRAHLNRLAARYDISPALLEALIWQESRWKVTAISPAGARGLTQLMPGTARELGVNSLDPVSNLEGGIRYLRIQLDAFGGDVEKALAAYNAGPGAVRRAGGIPQITETRAYVASIMARLTSSVRE